MTQTVVTTASFFNGLRCQANVKALVELQRLFAGLSNRQRITTTTITAKGNAAGSDHPAALRKRLRHDLYRTQAGRTST